MWVGSTSAFLPIVEMISFVIKAQRESKKAYEAYLMLETKGEEERAEETLEQCDDVFYKSEKELNHILNEYADKVKLEIPIFQLI